MIDVRCIVPKFQLLTIDIYDSFIAAYCIKNIRKTVNNVEKLHNNDDCSLVVYIHTVGEQKDSTKTPLYELKLDIIITSGVTEAWVDPLSCKMGIFFLMPHTYTEPSLNNFQWNGAKMF